MRTTTTVLLLVILGATVTSAANLRRAQMAPDECVAADATPAACCKERPAPPAESEHDGMHLCCVKSIGQWKRVPIKKPAEGATHQFCDFKSTEAHITNAAGPVVEQVNALFGIPAALAAELQGKEKALAKARADHDLIVKEKLNDIQVNDLKIAQVQAKITQAEEQERKQVQELQLFAEQTKQEEAGLTGTLDKLKADATKAQQAMEELISTKEHAANALKKFQDRVKECKGDGDKLQKDKTDAAKEIILIDQLANALREETAQARQALASEQQKKDEILAEVEAQKTAMQEIKTEDEKIQTKIKKYNTKLKIVKKATEAAQDAIAELGGGSEDARFKQLHARVSVFLESLAVAAEQPCAGESCTFEQRVATIDIAIKKLQTQHLALQELVQQMNALETQFNTEMANKQGELTTTQQESLRKVQKLSEDLSALDEKLMGLSEQMRLNEQKRIEMNKRLRKAIQEVQSQVDQLNQNSAQFEREITALMGMITDSRDTLKACMTKNKELQSDVDKLMSILTKDRANFDKTKREQETLQGELAQSLSTVKTDILKQQENKKNIAEASQELEKALEESKKTEAEVKSTLAGATKTMQQTEDRRDKLLEDE